MIEININKNIDDLAFEWSVDYKPFEENLHYKEYAKHGYKEGYLQAIKNTEKLLMALREDKVYL
jgi:hypothetical protein